MTGNGAVVSPYDVGRVVARMEWRDHPWSAVGLARVLGIPLHEAGELLNSMTRAGLLNESADTVRRTWRLNPSPEKRRRGSRRKGKKA